jgi:hypothetical protein
MTAAQTNKIIDLFEDAIGRQKAKEYTEEIEKIIDGQVQGIVNHLATKDDINKVYGLIITMFITLGLAIIGLYGSIYRLLSILPT